MFRAILGAGLGFARWWTLLAAVVLFLVGNHIRISAEEQLLRETFGAKFDEYARRIPGFFSTPILISVSAVAEFVDAQLLDAKLQCRCGDAHFFRGSIVAGDFAAG